MVAINDTIKMNDNVIPCQESYTIRDKRLVVTCHQAKGFRVPFDQLQKACIIEIAGMLYSAVFISYTCDNIDGITPRAVFYYDLT